MASAGGPASLAATARPLKLCKSNEGEMPERRQGSALHQRNAVGCHGPLRVALPAEVRAPAELARGRRKPPFERTAQSGFRADTADQHDLATGLEHPREFVQRGLRIGYRGDDVLRHHYVK